MVRQLENLSPGLRMDLFHVTDVAKIHAGRWIASRQRNRKWKKTILSEEEYEVSQSL